MLSFFAIIFDRFSKRLERWPASFYSIMSCSVFNSEFIAPFLKRFYNSIDFYNDSHSFIISLVSRCRPTAIFRRIVSININSIYRVSTRWLFTHIFKKIRKRMLPTLAHLYSTATIMFPTWNAAIGGSTFYCRPSPVCRFCVISSRKPMFRFAFNSHCDGLTSTRSSVSIFKSSRSYNFFVTAFATAKPFRITSGGCSASFNDFKISKNLTCQVSKIFRNLCITQSTCFGMSSLKTTCVRFSQIAAVTFAKPSGLISLIFTPLNNSETTKPSSSEIYKARHNILRQNIPYKDVCGRLIRFQLFGSYPIHTNAYSKVGA